MRRQLYIFSLIPLSIIGCSHGDSEKIDKIKSIVKERLIDGESAQFTDLKYYKSTNVGCGFVNAKNKMGGYVGKKKFVVSLEQNAAEIEPNRDLPSPPSMPSYASIESTMRYAAEGAAWKAEVDTIRSRYEAFDFLTEKKCTDTPPIAVENNKPDTPKDNVKQNSPFNLDIEKIPTNFVGVDLNHIMKQVSNNTRTKAETETTAEYSKRISSGLNFDPSPLEFNSLYAINLTLSSPDGMGMGTPSARFDYNADKGLISVTHYGSYIWNTPLCKDDHIGSKLEHPIVCNIGSDISLSISNKSKAIGRLLKKVESGYNLTDSFTFPREKLSQLPPRCDACSEGSKGFIVDAIIVGKLAENQANPSISGSYSVSGNKVVPFEIRNVIYYNRNNGEIIMKRNVD